MQTNAIILAAGKSSRFAPFTYERPKGLFCVRGEVLIERQIRQLRDAGIQEIYVVVGYMKEKFFYLEQEFGVHLIVNNTFAKNGNLYSLYVARAYLGSTFICCADHYYTENPFFLPEAGQHSCRLCSYQAGKFREFAVAVSDASVITDVTLGGYDSMAMVGFAYFDEGFSRRLRGFMEKEICDFGIDSMFWEEFFARHIKELTLFARGIADDHVLEFDDIDDLRRFDAEFLQNVDSVIITNICKTLACQPEQIQDIAVIQAGLTNVSFRFRIGQQAYVYRHPGGTSGKLIDRSSEIYAQKKAIELGIDPSVIRMEPEGWKLSYCVEGLIPCNFHLYAWQMKETMEYLHRLHAQNISEADGLKDFDTLQEALKLMDIASASKGNLRSEFSSLVDKAGRLDACLKQDAVEHSWQRVLCHNDVYEPNCLVNSEQQLYLIDWEYAGRNDPANDLGCIFGREPYTDEEIEQALDYYFGRQPTVAERRHFLAYIPLTAFYWFCWGLYKGSVGDDDGFFFLPAYRRCVETMDAALLLFEEKS